VDGVSTSASEGTAAVDARDSVGSSVGVCSPSATSSVVSATLTSTACSREGRARPSFFSVFRQRAVGMDRAQTTRVAAGRMACELWAARAWEMSLAQASTQ
jgi:hypothetical protein